MNEKYDEAYEKADEMLVLPKFLFIEDTKGISGIRVEYQEYSDQQHIIKNITQKKWLEFVMIVRCKDEIH